MTGSRARRRRLTPRQLEIIDLLSRPGATQPKVAAELGIAEQTVKNHLQTAYDRLDVTSFGQAVRALGQRLDRPPVR
jgi:DNA-binding NarL/FixJ family response regulator